MPKFKNACDGGHETNSEIRRLPLGDDEGIPENEKSNSAVLVCYNHYLAEIKWRKMCNESLADSCKFDLPLWQDLKVYEVE